MKGLFKGLRYISQIFGELFFFFVDIYILSSQKCILFEMISILSFVKLQNAENEKEPEMQIGTPTDVKHVAHIGWDGGSPNQNSPSWVFTHYFFPLYFQ